jgi:hypothetical protein
MAATPQPKKSPSIPREYRWLARRAKAAGWQISRTRGGHLAWKPPKGPTLFSPCTPSDRRSLNNFARKLARAGLNTRKKT